MSCAEVMYQAYYPYLYQRQSSSASPTSSPSASATASTSQHRSVSHFSQLAQQYGQRFNAERSFQSCLPDINSGYAAIANHQRSSAGSVSSGGGISSHGSPTRTYKEEVENLSNNVDEHRNRRSVEMEEEEESCTNGSGGRGGNGVGVAQYMSANCVVITHYTGNVADVVDEHFTRALRCQSDPNRNTKNTTEGRPSPAKENSPMIARNFPPSFWNSNYQRTLPSEAFVSNELHHHASALSAVAASDPWHYHQYTAAAAAHHHHRAVHEYRHHHHHNMAAAAAAAQYGGLLLPSSSRLPAMAHHHQYHHHPAKSAMTMDHWPPPPPQPSTSNQHRNSFHHDHLDASTSSPYATSYSSIAAAGLEAPIQECTSKDLYWF